MSPDLAITYCRMIAQTLDADAADQAALLQGTGIDAATLEKGEGFIDWPGARRLIANALDLSPRPGLGLRTGLRALPAMHGAMGMAAMVSATLRDAMVLFARFNNTRTRVFSTHLEEDEETITLGLDFAWPQDQAVRFLTESALASAFACHVVLRGRPIDDGAVHFNYPAPAHADLYREAFAGIQVVFDAPRVALTLPAHYGDEPVPSHDRELLWMAVRQCEARQEALRRHGSLSDQVLARLRDEPEPDLAAVAQALHVSPRTLIRRLKAEGTAFQALRDRTRAQRAAELLALPHYTVAAVARELGYTDVASFRRAFRRWYGTRPGDFRRP
ncbi:AraC family transcriptional regulator ligand-binding domain-containing protein [Alloalcanivorax sp. C16-1]|uniref:AraC family transcriptional regulator n=1 Tax=Alloalcanivorax sp. C16-1 TaxID=3390051 RepID=UPI00397059E4